MRMYSVFKLTGSIVVYVAKYIIHLCSEIDEGLKSKGMKTGLRWFSYGLFLFGCIFEGYILFSDQKFWDKIGATGSLASTLAIFPILYAVYEYGYGQTARERKRFERAIRTEGEKPGVLIIDLRYTTNASNTFECERKNLGLSNIPDDMIISYSWSDPRDIDSNDVDGICKNIMEKYRELISSGADEIHLFYAGPVAIAVYIGSIMGNKVVVKVYHFNKSKDADGKSYQIWRILNLPSGR